MEEHCQRASSRRASWRGRRMPTREEAARPKAHPKQTLPTTILHTYNTHEVRAS